MDSITHRLPASLETDRLVLTTPTLAHVPEMAVLAKTGFTQTHEGPGPKGTNAGAPTTFMPLQFDSAGVP